jgi:hypothetical protein
MAVGKATANLLGQSPRENETGLARVKTHISTKSAELIKLIQKSKGTYLTIHAAGKLIKLVHQLADLQPFLNENTLSGNLTTSSSSNATQKDVAIPTQSGESNTGNDQATGSSTTADDTTALNNERSNIIDVNSSGTSVAPKSTVDVTSAVSSVAKEDKASKRKPSGSKRTSIPKPSTNRAAGPSGIRPSTTVVSKNTVDVTSKTISYSAAVLKEVHTSAEHDPVLAPAHSDKEKGRSKKNRRNQGVLLIDKPNLSYAEMRAEVLSALKPAENELHIDYATKSKQGKMLLRISNQAELEKAFKLLKAKPNDGFNVIHPRQKTKIGRFEYTESGFSKDQIQKALATQNKVLNFQATSWKLIKEIKLSCDLSHYIMSAPTDEIAKTEGKKIYFGLSKCRFCKRPPLKERRQKPTKQKVADAPAVVPQSEAN